MKWRQMHRLELTFTFGDLADAMALANALKATMNAHAADAAQHTTAVDNVNFPVVTADATSLATLLTLVGDLLTAYDVHDDDAELGAGWAYHAAQEAADHSLDSAVAPANLAEAIVRLNDLLAKYNAHDADAVCHGVGSSHQEPSGEIDTVKTATPVFEGEIKQIHLRVPDFTTATTLTLTIEDAEGYEIFNSGAQARNANYNLKATALDQSIPIPDGITTFRATLDDVSGDTLITARAVIFYYGQAG
jgi:hypothetical protein